MADYSKIILAIDAAISALNELRATLEEKAQASATQTEPVSVASRQTEAFAGQTPPAPPQAQPFAAPSAASPAVPPAVAPSFAPPAQAYPAPPSYTSVASEMICPNCGASVIAGSKFCTKCGTPLQAAAPAPIQRGGFCTSCGAALSPVDKFCTKCGTRV